MPTNKTPNYQLSQWERDDKIQMEDFNADNAKIDTALRAQAATCASLQTLLNKKGNCSISTFTYTGNGSYGPEAPTVISFPQQPVAYIIFGRGILIGRGGDDLAGRVVSISGGSSVGAVVTSWSGSTLRIADHKADNQFNQDQTIYRVIAFYAQ